MKERTFKLWSSEKKEVLVVSAKREGRYWKALCPFHSDNKSSLVIDEQRGVFHCFGCGKKGGLFNSELVRSPLKPAHRQFLRDRRHDYNDKTIKHFGLKSEEYRGKEIICYNFQEVKRYLKITEKGIEGSWQSFPGHNVSVIGDYRPKRLILCEGEHDLMMAWQKELAGVCSFTGGAMSIPTADKLEVFEGKDVAIIYDHDKAGIEGAERTAQALLNIVHAIKIIQLPVKGDGQDLTDYFCQGGTKEDLIRRIDLIPPWGNPNFKEKDALIEKYRDKIYSDSSVKITKRSRLFDVVYYLIQRANIYTGQFRDTFANLGANWEISRINMINLFKRHLGDLIEWEGDPGRSGRTTFTIKNYPKVRFGK